MKKISKEQAFIDKIIMEGKPQCEILAHVIHYPDQLGNTDYSLNRWLRIRLPHLRFMLEQCNVYADTIGEVHALVQIQCPTLSVEKKLFADPESDEIIAECEKYLMKPVELNYVIEETLAEKNFYMSPAWRKLRYEVLKKYGRRCMACGARPGAPSNPWHGDVMHVDHIIPRSKRPDLALDINNLQVLCEPCNIGKGNRDNLDYRPKQ